MKEAKGDRRDFIKATVGTAAALAASTLPRDAFSLESRSSSGSIEDLEATEQAQTTPGKIKFSVIGCNHDHIYGQAAAVIRGGGELVSFYAKEPELSASFSR